MNKQVVRSARMQVGEGKTLPVGWRRGNEKGLRLLVIVGALVGFCAVGLAFLAPELSIGDSQPGIDGCNTETSAACDQPRWQTGVIGQAVRRDGEPSIRLVAATYRSAVPGLPAPPPGSVYLVLDVAMLAVGPLHLEQFSAEADRGGLLQTVEVPQNLAIPAEPPARNRRQGNLVFQVPLQAGAVTVRYTSKEGDWGVRWEIPAPSATVEPPTSSPGLGGVSPTPIWTPIPTQVPPTPTPSLPAGGNRWGPIRRGSLIVQLDAVYQSALSGLPASPSGSTYLILTLDLRAATADATFRANRFRAETTEGIPLTPVRLPAHQRLPERGIVTYSGKPVRGQLVFLIPDGTGPVTVRHLDADGESGIGWELPGPETPIS